MSIFSKVSENDITKAIVNEFLSQFIDCLKSDVIVIGAGPSGLIASREIAKNGRKVLVIEQNNYLGGGFWIGGFLMNKVTFRAPSQEILDKINIPYKEIKSGLFVADATFACSKLIASACEAGVKFLNMTSLDDVIIKDEKVSGVVVNWSPIKELPKQICCLDPIGIESELIIDSTGHECVVVRKLEKRGLLAPKGEGAMWLEQSEDEVVNKTGIVFPGLIVAGMATASMFGLPRMGPTFGGMLLSGKKAADIALEMLKEKIIV